MTDPVQTELKGCPFCGHDDIGVDLLGDRTRVWCHESCYASITDIDTNRAIETWNTRAPQWQPIETAPSIWVQVWYPPRREVSIAHYDDEIGTWEDWDGVTREIPTHWMPLPQPPEGVR